MSTDTSEKGLETLIMRHMTGVDGLAVAPNMVSISRLSAKTLDESGNLDETEAEEI